MIQESSSSTSITIDPTFWVAFFAFLTVIVNAVVTYKTKQKTEEIAQKVDGAATAAEAKLEAMRVEIARLNEDRLARADAAPSVDAVAALPTLPVPPVPVVIKDTEKTVPVEVIVKQVP